MFSAACLLTSAAILFYIVRYRIHITISYSPRSRVTSGKKGRGPREPRFSLNVPRGRNDAGTPSSPTRGFRTSGEERGAPLLEITSALVNLGCPKEKAKLAAIRACADPGTFEEQLRRALQEAA